MESLVALAKEIVGPQPGSALLLFVLCGVALWAYWKEKNKNDLIADERLVESRQDTQLVMETLSEATATIKEVKSSNEALRSAFESLTSVARNNHETIKTLIEKLP